MDAASQRLVFLVEIESEQIGFEIRSLQEFMAAESLMDGTDQIIRERLDGIASIPFWRNVFLFAAGKCFAERQELREAVYATCASLNETDDDKLAGTYLAGSDLAIALLEEGSARRQPKFENLLARIAIRALDTAKSSQHIELADIYESRLQGIFRDEIKLRLAGGLKISSLGAWNCLLRLITRDTPWANSLAEQNWPRDQQEQIDILHAVGESTKNPWAVKKLLHLIPSTSVFTFAPITELAAGRDLLDYHVLEPQQEAAVSVLMASFESVVNMLNTGLSYGSLVRLEGSNYPSAHQLRHFENWHSSWRVYKYAGDFLEAPSKESLASTLSLIADHIYAEGEEQTNLKRWSLPWPILACVNSCNSSIDLLKLARKAAQGKLGDVGDWASAETRWFESGITRDDLVSMSDDRLPFDEKIRESGFPTDLGRLSMIIYSQGTGETLKDVLGVFGEIAFGKTRSFVAEMINRLIYVCLLSASRDEASRLSGLDLQTLKSVYREVTSGSSVPLDPILYLIGESVRDVAEFFTSIEDKNFLFSTIRFGRDLPMEEVKVLRNAYMGLNEDSGTLLSALGTVAENGQLLGQHVDIVVPMSQLKQPEKVAAFIIMLSQETWDIDNCEQLIESAQEIGDLSSNDFNRIVTTLETNRPTGDFVEKFVVALRNLVPLDDYFAHKRYVSLLGDVIRKRTSRFSDSNNSSQFDLPEGVVELFRE